MTDSEKRPIMVVSHTHWDREWYLPFETFRSRLVAMMDKLLHILETNPDYKHFMLDGQSIILEDYLEIRPDRREEIARQVQAGRLLVGPWYALPDEFLVGGESLVRNLQRGIAVARQFGPPMMVGYLPDMFGHIAHMPAILAGFGIAAAVIWRGVDRSVPTSEFFWRTADGSEVLAIHLPQGYGIGQRLPLEREALLNRLHNIRQIVEPWASTRYLLLPNGDDHVEAQPELPAVIALANENLDDAELMHATLPMYIEAVRQEMGSASGGGSWPRVEGEFRSGQRAWVLPSVSSTRMWIKQRNQECEDLLLRWAEPFSAWANLIRQRNGDSPDRSASDAGLLGLAWKLLLQNHPHDSICGCSIDQVHEEMAVRFDRCRDVGEAVARDALRYLAESAAPDEGTHVVVFNPLDGPRTDLGTARLPLRDGREPLWLEDEAGGSPLPLQPLRRGLLFPRDTEERLEVAFVAPDVPAYGYKAFRVGYAPSTGSGQVQPTRRRPAAAAQAMENEFFRVEADGGDGTITLTDKAAGTTLSGLNRFVDGGDCGDEYNYCPPARDELMDAPGRPPRIRLVEDGPARWSLEIALDYSLPRRLAANGQGRTRQRQPYRIVSHVSIYAGVPRVDFETEVDNQVEDHRLRVHFPTGLRAQFSHAEQHFGVVARPVALPEADGTWMEEPQGTYPQKTFVDVNDGQRGLLLANRGLPEYEVIDGPNGATIALTLLRCVGFLSRPIMATRRAQAGPLIPAPGAQCAGKHVFHYSLVPHSGGWESAFVQAHRFAHPLRAVTTSAGKKRVAAEASLLSVRPSALVLSAVKAAEDGRGIIVRLYNVTPQPVWGEVRLEEPRHVGVEVVDLNEEPLGAADVEDGWVRLSAKPNEIVTLKFSLSHNG
ncbi:MAG: glycoside hydrolase family 38 C-terminal domain-containing protein [Chloroflexota bacterium]|nr:glycoside hydrolase family 38 C-terminal domain-containing protein [Chloroflexota bacterium]